MSIEFTSDFREFDNGFLGLLMDYVSADISDGSILQEVNSGRDGSGGVTFTPCTDATGFNYDLAIGKTLTSRSTRTVQMYVEQTATQGTLGGRLVTFIDSTEDVFGATVQVAINIMDDNTLAAYRANAQGTGFILRNTDQAGDSQMTLLGTSSGTLDGTDYLEIEIVHHPTTGSITVWKDGVEFWVLENVNTAISGQNQSSTVYWGGYGVIETGGDTLHHEDLAAIISDVMVINSAVNPDDPNDPTQRIGDHKPLLSLPTADANYTQFTPNPVGSHFANVDEIPPDFGDTENSASETALRDNFAMQDAAGTGSNQVYLTYQAFVKADTPVECGVSDAPANFEAFVYTAQTDPGEVHTTPPTGPPCNLSDFVSRRAQTVCTISQDGEKVTFKPLTVSPVNIDAYFVGLSPLNAPPRLQTPTAPGYFAAAGFHPKADEPGGLSFQRNVNVTAIPGHVTYDLPWYQPWYGLACDTNDEFRLAGDYFEFELNEDGIGVDVGFGNNSDLNAPFNPYSTPLIAFHFREDIEGSPYFWISPSFGYAGETVYTHSPGDRYRIVRNDPNVELYQNAFLLETFSPGGPLDTILDAYVFCGRWGFVTPFGYIRRPGIKNAVARIGSIDCCPAHYNYGMLTTAFANDAIELQQWGVKFNDSFSDCFVYDPGSTHGPFPQAGYDADTRFEFSLESGNVVLRIYDPTFLSGIPNVAGVGTWTYTIPYADTDNFMLLIPVVAGPPDYPNSTLEYDFVDATANQPLRLVAIFGADNGGITQGITDVSFTFLGSVATANLAGFMRQDSVDRSGTTVEAPTGNYAYRQSFLSSTPGDTPITLDDFNATDHGYTDPSE